MSKKPDAQLLVGVTDGEYTALFWEEKADFHLDYLQNRGISSSHKTERNYWKVAKMARDQLYDLRLKVGIPHIWNPKIYSVLTFGLFPPPPSFPNPSFFTPSLHLSFLWFIIGEHTLIHCHQYYREDFCVVYQLCHVTSPEDYVTSLLALKDCVLEESDEVKRLYRSGTDFLFSERERRDEN